MKLPPIPGMFFVDKDGVWCGKVADLNAWGRACAEASLAAAAEIVSQRKELEWAMQDAAAIRNIKIEDSE